MRQLVRSGVALCDLALVSSAGQAAISDLNRWTLVQDPPSPGFSGSATSTLATLTAGATAVPLATDIGYQSVDADTVALSTTGYAFDQSTPFSVAVDYSIAFSGTPTGALTIGFGIGKDADGTDSAGAVVGTLNGAPFGTFGAAARIDDTDQTPFISVVGATLTGTLFAEYDPSNGNVTLGGSQTPGSALPDGGASTTYAGIDNQWAQGDLLASFFIRSGPGFAWQGTGSASVRFLNLRILQGAAFEIPTPGTVAAILTAATICTTRRRRS